MVGANFRKYEHFEKIFNKTYTSYTFYTFVNPYLTELHAQWYKIVKDKYIKIVPINID